MALSQNDLADHMAWLRSGREEAIEPDLPITDPHVHFWRAHPPTPYLIDDLVADADGHRLEKVVFVECLAEYRSEGPAHLAPAGETAFVAGLAQEARNRTDAPCIAAIVGFADLRGGAQLEEALDAHIAEADGLFRGIRHSGAYHPNPSVPMSHASPPPGLYDDPAFRDGLKRLAARGLSFDSWNYHTQLGDLIRLAKAVPEATIICNHMGGPLGVGPYAGKQAEVLRELKVKLRALADCPNVALKLGGLAMERAGFGWRQRARPPSSDEVVAIHGDIYRAAIDAFGPERAMFESNFPVDKLGAPYGTLWNAFKKIASDYSTEERLALIGGTARRIYRIDA